MVFKSCGGILELQREIQTSSCVGPMKTNLPFELRGRDGCCSRVTVGQNRPHLGFCPGHNVPLQGQQGSRGCIPDSPEVRPHLEGKQSTLLSSQVATGISWSPLSGLKGVKPPVKFGERTRDCSPGQAGKEGPHLSLTGASCGFSRTAAPVWVFSRGTMRYSGSLLCGTREVSFPACGEGSASLLWRHGRGIGHQETLKKDSPSLSRVTSGNSGFPRLVPVTSGSFSGSL